MIHPVLPETDPPVLNAILPDTPLDDTFAVDTTTEPDPADALPAVAKTTAPPAPTPLEAPL